VTAVRARRVVLPVAVLAMAGATVLGYQVADPFGARSAATTIDNAAPTGLGRVTRQDLSARVQQSGTLGYAGDYQVVNQASGTATTLPTVGDVIRQGGVLYRVDGAPVLLLTGRQVPGYRALSRGMTGADVRQLNTALVALGYATSSTLDPSSDSFGWPTYTALRALQDAVGLTVTGQLPLGQVVFLPVATVRVTKVNAVRGTRVGANQPVLEVSSTGRQVTVKLDADRQTTVVAGDRVTITLPTGRTTSGRVSSVGKVASQATDGTVTVEVLITPLKPAETGQLDQAPVQVSIVSQTAKKVLSVPVTALLALAGGGQAVEVVDATGSRRLVTVRTGLFDDSAGRVEVAGAGLAAGQRVVVPAS
jgi:hypothetical protein